MDVYLPLGNFWAQSPRQDLRLIVSSPLCGAPLAQCFCLLQEPQLQHPTWHLQMSPSARLEFQGALWSTIIPKYSHQCSCSVGELDLSHEKKPGTVCKHAPSGNCSSYFFHWGFFSWSSLSLEVFFHRAFDKETCQCMAKPIQYCKVK